MPEFENNDGPEVDWKALAQRLQAEVTRLEAELAAVTVQSSDATAALEQIREKQNAEALPLTLKDYKAGERVSVLKNYNWLDGQITSIDRGSHHLHVHTERGPVTIASPMFVKKLT